MGGAFASSAFSIAALSTAAFLFDAQTPPVQQVYSGGGRRFIHDGIIFNIEEDDEELMMLITACAPLMRH